MNLLKNEHEALKLLLLFVFEFNGAKILRFVGMFGQTLWQVDLLRATCASGPSCKLYYTRYCAEQSRDKGG